MTSPPVALGCGGVVDLKNDHFWESPEAEAADLTPERMRAMVHAAFDDAPADTFLDRVRALTTAATVLRRADCPHDVLLTVVMHPEWDTRLPGHVLLETVLSRPDCPDEIQVAAALAMPSRWKRRRA